MVNVLSFVCFSTLFLSSLVGAASDRSPRRFHHDAARMIQRRAAEAHHAVLLADLAKRSAPALPARKRAAGRCKPHTTTSALSTTTSSTHTTSTAVHTTTTIAIGNPGGNPTTTKVQSTHKPAPPRHTTTTKKAVEKPATTHKAVTTTKASNGGGGGGDGGSGDTFSGDGTYYGVALGSCGWTNTDNELVAAVSQILYDGWPGATANPNNNPICGRYITAHYGGKSVRVKVVDRCVGCKKHDVDFSPTAFKRLADQSLGRISITWAWS